MSKSNIGKTRPSKTKRKYAKRFVKYKLKIIYIYFKSLLGQ